MMSIRISSVVLLTFASTAALAHGPLPKADICHWSDDTQSFEVINISEHAVDPHFANHGDTYPGEFWVDADGDGYGDADGFDSCRQNGFVGNSDDCDDGNANVNPGMSETPYNGLDDDCNPGTPDDDLDGDGYGIATDCDDGNANVNPGMSEIPNNGIDDDCDPSTPGDGTCSTGPSPAGWIWLMVPGLALMVRRRS